VRRASIALLLAACSGPGVDLDAGLGRDARDASAAVDAAAPSTGPWLEDRSARAGIAFVRPLPDGYASLVARLGGGVCAIDADGAPPLDLFFPARADGSRLFIARAPFVYADETVDRGLDAVGDALGCLAFDADADGDTDLLVTGVGILRLWMNEGNYFVAGDALLSVRVPAGHVMTSAAAGDLDGDGDVDLVVAGFVDASTVPTGDCGGLPCAVLIASQPYLPNRVLLNDGVYRELAPIEAGPFAALEPTLVVGISDLDGDGRTETYVGNDAGDLLRDRAIRFEGGAPVDVSDAVGLAYDQHGNGIDTMGWTTGDVNGDLRLDHAVAPFEGYHSPIFLCGDDGFCEDFGRQLGTNAVGDSFRWANALVDLDLDGDLDLVEATGHVFTAAEGDAIGFPVAHEQPPNLLTNAGDGHFARVVPEADDALATARAARGMSVVDLDDDGRLDLVFATSRGEPAVLRNVRPPVGHWLRVVLRGRAPNRDAIGARVVVRGERGAWVRRRVAGEGFLGSFDPRLSFGVPEPGPVSVEITWPSGRTSRVPDVALDRELALEE
jgi:hypothetical protein